MMDKIKEGDPSITDREALDYALLAKNIETNNKGFSSMQIVYGNNPSLPGITNGTPASFETEFLNDDIKKHIVRTNLARISFLQADADNRLKRVIKSRINTHDQ